MMPEITVTIGGREFHVSCQEGEERYLLTAAGLLDNEAVSLTNQTTHLPEGRMLLMAGLMLADKTAELKESHLDLEDTIEALKRELAEARAAPEPEKIEVAVIPTSVTDALAEIAARAEAVADSLEEQTA